MRRAADAPHSQHRAVLHERAQLAGGFIAGCVAALTKTVESLRRASGLRTVTFGGSFVASAELSTELQKRLGDVVFAPVPEDVGMALGAALLGHDHFEPASHLALGPAYE